MSKKKRKPKYEPTLEQIAKAKEKMNKEKLRKMRDICVS
ncbi:hypothetical protein LCGC14_1829950 [marine sediment metagenome]|uniref:Uncharacterized protein n=1 Tax=marine sediment metagenome TaxID=412755 RepID=A0A0F9GGE2_9ZZZZ